MSGDLRISTTLEMGAPLFAAQLKDVLASIDGSDCVATVIGYGTMGKQYVKALRALGVGRIRVCSRAAEPLAELHGVHGIETRAGGIEHCSQRAEVNEIGILATPTASLHAAAERLIALGFRHLLIEKPVSLWSREIETLAERCEVQGVEAHCAYNRVAYPAFHEVRARIAQEGGATSCAYTFTEIIKPDWPQRFPAQELFRWGIANSLHVMSLAHGLIGLPEQWSGERFGALPWHPTGAIFVGYGISTRRIPFTYHADWGSTGRWSVEVHTTRSSYRLCPLEQVFQRVAPTADWTEVPVTAFAPQVKAGVTEQVAAMLDERLRASLPLMSLRDAAALTRYGEGVFGYDAT